jgi:hypothetical protein
MRVRAHKVSVRPPEYGVGWARSPVEEEEMESWAKMVGRSLTDHYWRSKGRDLAQSEFVMRMNAEMQARNPGRTSADVNDVETLRKELEPKVIADVRQRHPDFVPQRLAN